MSEVGISYTAEQSGSAAAANSVRQQGISGQQSTPGTDLAQRTPAMKIVRRGKGG